MKIWQLIFRWFDTTSYRNYVYLYLNLKKNTCLCKLSRRSSWRKGSRVAIFYRVLSLLRNWIIPSKKLQNYPPHLFSSIFLLSPPSFTVSLSPRNEKKKRGANIVFISVSRSLSRMCIRSHVRWMRERGREGERERDGTTLRTVST